jgi:1-deoxy-D-xylulose-5-phosphate synthase
MLAKEGIEATVVNARFIKPLDEELLVRYCRPGARVVTVEEGSIAGGFGSAVMEKCAELGISGVEFHNIGIPDVYVSHGSQNVLRSQYDLHPEGIAARTRAFVRQGASAPRVAS